MTFDRTLGHFDVGVLERFLDAEGVLRDLAHELLSGPGDVAQILNPSGRNEATTDQAMGEQIGDPGGVVDVGLAPRNVPNVLGVCEHELETAIEHMPDRLPVDTGGLHCDMGAAGRLQPVGERAEFTGRRAKCPNLSMLRRAHATDASHDRVFVDIKARTAGVKDLHLPSRGVRRAEPSSSKSTSRAPGSLDPWSQFGVLAGFRVQLLNGLVAPRRYRPPARRIASPYPTGAPPLCFIRRGRSAPMGNY